MNNSESLKIIILIFAVIPLIGAVFLFLTKILKGKKFGYIFEFSLLIQFITGCFIIWKFDGIPMKIQLTSFKIIAPFFEISKIRIIFLTLYLLMIFFVWISRKRKITFDTINPTLIFMFFLSGCSGLVFSSDMFTYYVYYELMILCSYVLITGDEKYYAALKYMIFNSVSSMFFLGGIGIHYYSQGNLIISGETIKDTQAITLFLIAFLIKGGFFPASSWVPTCHSGARNIFSGCLSSFAISTGVLGLYRFVIAPSEINGFLIYPEIIKYVSVITIILSSLFLFFEHNLKKAVTHSTVYVMGVCGMLLGGGEKELVFIYLIIHCFYKMFMFMLLYDIDYSDKNDNLCIKTNKSGKILFILAVLFAGGFFPSFTYFAKMAFSQYFPGIKIIWYISMFFIFAGFFKFNFIVEKGRPTQKKKIFFMSTALSIPIIGIILKKLLLLKLLIVKIGFFIKLGGIKGFLSKAIIALLTYFNSKLFDIHQYFLIDVIVLIAALTLSKWLISLDKRRIEKLIANFSEDLNLELFAILLLSAICINIVYFQNI
ncbi:MAG: hypothetical protein M0R46_09405 [Candidatus Muirbacterium halophilum]|nr:hypothetical protein [Candidatus Muirbacterium halophilum]MCK9476124.1 hypothetical protein [Candidatus Muirbacterium halophilum]